MSFLQLLTQFPGILPSILLGALLVLWLLVIMGVVDHEHFGPDWLGGGHDSVDTAPEILMTMGLDKLPFSIVISGIVFFWWLFTLLAVALIWTWLPLPAWIAGSAILIAALVAAVPSAAVCLRPLKPLFVVHTSIREESVVGKPCKILTLTVDETFGQAEVVVGTGHVLNVRVCADVPNQLTKGSSALIIDMDQKTRRYRVEAYSA